MYCRLCGIYKGKAVEQFLAFCPTTEVLTADCVRLLPLWLWFVKGQENPAQRYVIFLSLAVVLIFLCCRITNSVFSFCLFSTVFLHLYLMLSFVAFTLTRGRAETFQFMRIERQQWFCPVECLLYVRPVLFWPREWKQNVNLKVNLEKKKKKDKWYFKHWVMNLAVSMCRLSRIKSLFILAAVGTLIVAAVCCTKMAELSFPGLEVHFFPVASCNVWMLFVLLEWLLMC